MKDMSNAVEEAYRKGLKDMEPKERVMRTCSLYTSVKNMLAHQIRSNDTGISDFELKIKIARRMYLSDPKAQALLNQLAPNG